MVREGHYKQIPVRNYTQVQICYEFNEFNISETY
jgi:hypothetical protein